MEKPDYSKVTELAGEEISREQVERVCNRYFWAGEYCKDKDVLEIACGTGPGLGYLEGLSKSLVASDIAEDILETAKQHYGNRVSLQVVDAMNMPFEDNSLDVIIIFEALYYLPDAEKFVANCKRILRPGGVVLVSNANKDLFDFNPSPYSFEYHGAVELDALFGRQGFDVKVFGSTPVTEVSTIQKLLRPVKTAAVRFNLMPKTMAGKRILKRLVFGKPVLMPAEISADTADYVPPTEISTKNPDKTHKVLYCCAQLI